VFFLRWPLLQYAMKCWLNKYLLYIRRSSVIKTPPTATWLTINSKQTGLYILFRSPHQNSVRNFLLSHLCYMLSPLPFFIVIYLYNINQKIHIFYICILIFMFSTYFEPPVFIFRKTAVYTTVFLKINLRVGNM
jgi:hypothetical protein